MGRCSRSDYRPKQPRRDRPAAAFTDRIATRHAAVTSASYSGAIRSLHYGYNNFDVRHAFNLSLVYPIPFGDGRRFGSGASRLAKALLGGWDVGGIANARSGLPVDIKIVRPDVVYRDAAGNSFANPAADRVAVINVLGGGGSRNVRRPDLVPGVDPLVKDGGLLFLNAAAFATPAPGAFGNLERNAIHGPGFRQIDFFFAKHFGVGRTDLEFRGEIFNLFDSVNFSNPSARCLRRFPRMR